MTDNEIIKALECCSSAITADDCERLGCPCFADPQTCIFSDNRKIQRVIDGTLNLINHQKAEIERLTTEKDNLIKTYKECVLEVIKEFVERLEQEAFECDVSLGYGKEADTKVVSVLEIERITKEMEGEG